MFTSATNPVLEHIGDLDGLEGRGPRRGFRSVHRRPPYLDAAAQPAGESVEKDSPLIGASVRKIGSLGSGQADVTRGGRRLLL